MSEQEFNLKFNLHKAYIDIGLCEGDISRYAATYGFKTNEEVFNILKKFEEKNKVSAKEILADCSKKITCKKPVKITYIGDSITSERESHLNIMREVFASYENICIFDTSVSGYKSGDVVTSLLPNILPTKPDIIVMMIGTNDVRRTADGSNILHTSLQEYTRNIEYIIKYLVNIKVIVCTLPPFCLKKINAFLPDYKMLFTKEDIEEYNNAIIESAKKFNAKVVDMRHIYKKYNGNDLTLEDGLHLNREGQTLLAKQVYNCLVNEINAM